MFLKTSLSWLVLVFSPLPKKHKKKKKRGRKRCRSWRCKHQSCFICEMQNNLWRFFNRSWWGQRPEHDPSRSNRASPRRHVSLSISESRDACASEISVKCVYVWVCVVFCFSSLILFLTPFGPLFDVQIVGCQPGLAVVSKLEVSKLISGSINEILSVWDDRRFNRPSQRRRHGAQAHKAHPAPKHRSPEEVGEVWL